jgi:hypothetical protein
LARPAKPIATQTGHNATANTKARAVAEKILKGKDDKIIPAEYLSTPQAVIFNSIVAEMKASGILGNLDVYILTQCSIVIDRLQTIENDINNNVELMYNSGLQSARAKYSADLYRCLNELSMSPAARAKVGSIKVEKAKEDPLLKALKIKQ